MNNSVFQQMDGNYQKAPEESEQQYMERILRKVFEPNADLDTFNERFRIELDSCSADGQTLTIRFQPEEWQKNQDGNLHGGIIAAVHDIAMGCLAKFFMANKNAVTVQMNTEYMSRIAVETPFLVRSFIEKCGSRICFLRSQFIDPETGRILSAGSSVYL